MATTTYVDFTAAVRGIGNRTDAAGLAVGDISAEEDRLAQATLTEGAVTAGAFVVKAVVGSMNVEVGSGSAKSDLYAVAGDIAGQGVYLARLDQTPVTVTVPAADASQVRTDEVWLVVADSAYDGGTVSLPRLSLRKGDPGLGAPGPDVGWKAAAKLATIVVPAGAIEITAGDITDERAVTLAGDHGALAGLADDDHPQYAKKSGDTFAGFVRFDAGILPDVGLNAFDSSQPSDAFPLGYSAMRVTSTSGPWPGSGSGMVESIRLDAGGRQWQRFTDGNTGLTTLNVYLRYWDTGLAAWTDWQTNATSTGTYTGDGAVDRVVALPFTPKWLWVVNESGYVGGLGEFFASAVSASGGDAAQFREQADTTVAEVGVVTRPLPTTNGVIVSGTSNTSGNLYRYVAFA
jgi:hypothetical protein